MADADFSVKAIISAQTSQFEQGIKNVQKEINKTSSNFSKFTTGLKNAFIKGGAIGIGIATVTTAVKTLSNTLKQSIKMWEQADSGQKKLIQTLKVTGAETWATTEDLNAMADAYQKATNFASDDVTKMQTVLLGFKNITKDTFESASDAILDMAEVMGMDLVSATQTVGKALDDPISGLGSLSRQGFKFSETEKELIKNLVDAGESVKAQKIILDELNTTYGEAAKKGAKASIQLKNSWNSVLEEMGRNIVLSVDTEPAQKKLNKMLEDWKKALKESADTKQLSDDLIKAQKAVNDGTATYEQNLLLVEDEIKKIGILRISYEEAYNNAVKNNWESDIEYNKEHLDSLDYELKMLNARKKIIEEVIASEKEELEKQEKAKKEADERQAIEDSINALKLKYQKIILEQEKQWKLQEKVTGETVNLEEKRNFYQQKLIEIINEAGGKITENNQYYKDQMEIIKGITDQMSKEPKISTDWLDKLKEQRIEMLEMERDRAIEYAEEAGEESYTIWRDYNEKILNLKLERLNEEKEEELSEEGLSEEQKLALIEYYKNEEMKIYDELGEYKSEEKEEEEEEEESKFAKMLRFAKNFVKATINIFSKVAETIKKVFNGIVNFTKNVFNGLKDIFSTLFEFNPDEALDNLLKIEDAILTFFVETLPKLPNFFESAFSSVLTLIQTLINSIDWGGVENILTSIVQTFTTYAPQILSGIVELFSNLVTSISNVLVENAPEIVSAIGQMFFTILEALPGLIENFLKVAGTYLSEIGKYITDNSDRLSKDLSNIVESIVKGISNFIESGGWRNILSAILAIQNAIQNAITENLPAIVDVIVDALPDLINFLIDSIVSASKALTKVIRPVIKLIMELINALIEVIFSDEIFDVALEFLVEFIEVLLTELLPRLATLIPKLIVKIIGFIVKNIPKLISGIITGLVKGFTSVNWGQVIADIFNAFIDAIKDLFGIHSPSTLFEGFGTFMVEGLVNGLKGISESVMIILQPLVDLIKGLFDGLFNAITEPINNVVDSFTKINELGFETLQETLKTLADLFTNLSNITFTAIIDLSKMGFDALIKVLETVSNLFTDISKISFIALQNALDSVLGTLKDLTGLTFQSIVDLSKIGFDTLKSVLTTIKDILKDINNVTFKTLEAGLNTIKDVVKIIADLLTNITKISFDGFNNMFKGVADVVKVSGKSIVAVLGAVVQAIGDLWNEISDIVKGITTVKIWTPWKTYEIGGVDLGKIKLPDISKYTNIINALATGTNAAEKGLTLVGEAGPELVNFRGGEQVLNNRNTNKALANMGGKNIVNNITFNNLQDTTAYAMMQQMRQYNRQLAINGVF